MLLHSTQETHNRWDRLAWLGTLYDQIGTTIILRRLKSFFCCGGRLKGAARRADVRDLFDFPLRDVLTPYREMIGCLSYAMFSVFSLFLSISVFKN